MKYYIYKISMRLTRYMLMVMMLVMSCIVIFMINGYMEKGAVNSIINNFKERGVFEIEKDIQGQKVSIYKISPFYEYEIKDNRQAFDTSFESLNYIGRKADITLTTRNPLRLYGESIIRDFGSFFSTRFFIGHATINITDDGSKYIESVGNDNEFYGVREADNTWILTEIRKGNDAQKIICLRIKGIDDQDREEICNNFRTLVGKKYNKNLLIYKKNAYYCTDLISRTLAKRNISINYDSFYPTGNDFIVSDNTFPVFYCERISDGVFEIYYLSEE